MISRDKEALNRWVKSVIDTENAARKAENNRKRQQLIVRLGGEIWEWERRQNNDAKYLEQEGALQVFKDAERILEVFLPDTHVNIVKPKQEDPIVDTHLELLWDIHLVPPSWDRVARRVLCFVAREDGIPVGFRLNNSEEVLPNRTFLGRSLIEAIKASPIIAFAKKLRNTDEIYTLIKL